MQTHRDMMKTLPVTGARLIRFRFCGNGKDSEATIEIEGGRKLIVPLSYAEMHIDACLPVPIRTRGRGDTQVAIEIAPAAEKPVMIGKAAVEFPGSDDEWNEDLRDYPETGRCTLSWCVRLHLRLDAM